MTTELRKPITLPCGLVLPNRLVKAAMQELMANSNNIPDDRLVTAYTQWASGNWGGIITGNVQVDRDHLGAPLDVALRASDDIRMQDAVWRQWATSNQRNGTPTIVQLCHPGRQSPAGAGSRGYFAKTLAPSAVPLTLGTGHLACTLRSAVFGTPRAMTVNEIEDVVQRFAKGAQFLAGTGFSGVEIHAAHGYLLAQFLSPQMNQRTDDYGGTSEKRAKILVDIISETRKLVPRSFCIGVKFNSVDHQHASNLNETMRQIQLLVDQKIDFLEISGGSYEDPRFVLSQSGKVKPRTAEREAFFMDFAKEVRQRFPKLILMVTGGFRTRRGMQSALDSGACDLIGLARPAVANPSLPQLLLDPDTADDKAEIHLKQAPQNWLVRHGPVKLLRAGAETKMYSTQIHRMGKGLAPDVPTKTATSA